MNIFKPRELIGGDLS